MSRSQFQSKRFILRHAWLNLWDERMTTGRINQVAIFPRQVLEIPVPWGTEITSKRLARAFAPAIGLSWHRITSDCEAPSSGSCLVKTKLCKHIVVQVQLEQILRVATQKHDLQQKCWSQVLHCYSDLRPLFLGLTREVKSQEKWQTRIIWFLLFRMAKQQINKLLRPPPAKQQRSDHRGTISQLGQSLRADHTTFAPSSSQADFSANSNQEHRRLESASKVACSKANLLWLMLV